MNGYRLDLEAHDTPPHCQRPEIGCSVFVRPTTGMSVKTLERSGDAGLGPLLLFVGPGGGGATIHLDSMNEVVRLHRLLGRYLETVQKAGG